MSSQGSAIPVSSSVTSSVEHERLSWGRYPRVKHRQVWRVEWADQVPSILDHVPPHGLLPYGLGRSYGDCCLNAGGELIDCSSLDRFLAADFDEGWVRCEGGTSLADIIKIIVPRGFFLPVTPGTKFVTVGGAIANDVHGKNHHRRGTFGRHVRRLALCRSGQGTVFCGPDENAELFRATIGGLGLTGVILWAEIQLIPIAGSNINVEVLPFRSLEKFLALTAESDAAFEYTVAWIDCFASRETRGLFFRGNHANTSPSKPARVYTPRIAFPLPKGLLNGFTIKAFNQAYFSWKSWRRGSSIQPYERFFYPLDSIGQWNLLYGRQGFLQYQCVIPESAPALERILQTISQSSMGSFLGVLKRFGAAQSPGLLSFPRPGLTLALDFAMRGESTLQLLQSLDELVLGAGGALYPAKDARMSPAMFEASFPAWRDLRPYIDDKLSSSFWRRVTGTEPS
ncbi:MAG TPA: FAD-binding oxidoreductase [Candidatus Angelobacter sp.]|nr:FAD-binding oxidoreductase [Candidatus Angelobacter sp.]